MYSLNSYLRYHRLNEKPPQRREKGELNRIGGSSEHQAAGLLLCHDIARRAHETRSQYIRWFPFNRNGGAKTDSSLCRFKEKSSPLQTGSPDWANILAPSNTP